MIEVVVRARGQDAHVKITHPDGSTEDTDVVAANSSGLVTRTFVIDDDDTFEVTGP